MFPTGLNILIMKIIRNSFLIFIFSGFFAFANFLINPNRPNLELASDEITLSSIKKLSQNAIIVDARSPAEFADAHIEGAINLSEEKFDTQLGDFLDAWTPESTIIVYCGNAQCNSSRNIANRLKNECEIKNVFVLKDDWRKWKSSKQ